VKLSGLIVLLIANVLLSAAYAEPTSTQPLTRLDCQKAGLPWNGNANVCGSTSEAAERSGQPLTRAECDKAGMTWNDKANVCSEQSQTQAAAKTTSPVPATILINIDKTKQRMTVFLDGVERYDWPVSTGKAGYSTPAGSYTALETHTLLGKLRHDAIEVGSRAGKAIDLRHQEHVTIPQVFEASLQLGASSVHA
jgi:hypothetical protein